MAYPTARLDNIGFGPECCSDPHSLCFTAAVCIRLDVFEPDAARCIPSCADLSVVCPVMYARGWPPRSARRPATLVRTIACRICRRDSARALPAFPLLHVPPTDWSNDFDQDAAPEYSVHGRCASNLVEIGQYNGETCRVFGGARTIG